MEVAAGIHRIESSLGVRLMAQYVLAGDARTLLVDTGMPYTPADSLKPYLESSDLGLESIDEVLISHVDLDHSGGNSALRDLHPGRAFRLSRARSPLDRVERRDVAENYLWHERYGFDEPDEEGRAELKAMCGGDAPIDEGLRGGETIRLGGSGGSRYCISPATRSAYRPLGPARPCGDRDRRCARARDLREQRTASDPRARERRRRLPSLDPALAGP